MLNYHAATQYCPALRALLKLAGLLQLTFLRMHVHRTARGRPGAETTQLTTRADRAEQESLVAILRA